MRIEICTKCKRKKESYGLNLTHVSKGVLVYKFAYTQINSHVSKAFHVYGAKVASTGTCSNISLFIIFHVIYGFTIEGAIDKNRDLIVTNSMLIWISNFLSIVVFLGLPSRKIIALHDRSTFTARKSCK